MNTLQITHLRPYDALFDNITMYDKLPYDRDISLCGPESIALESGNIIKYFRCALNEPISIDNKDNVILKKITEYRKQEERRREAMADRESVEEPPQLTETEVEGLFSSNPDYLDSEDDEDDSFVSV